MDFRDRVVIVTGGAQGIGRACVLAFAREGATVVIADRDAAATETLVGILTSIGSRVLPIIADVSQEADAARVAADTVATFGGIDVLINNAGIQTYGTVESTPLERWNATIATNLTGVYLMSHFVVPELRRRGGGAIVNVASVYGLGGARNLAAYAASKGGVISLTRAMALDYSPDAIRVNCVCPGVIDTSLLREAARLEDTAHPDERLKLWGQHQPLGRLGNADEVAEVIMFLAGPRSGFITGATYNVDGGLSVGF